MVGSDRHETLQGESTGENFHGGEKQPKFFHRSKT